MSIATAVLLGPLGIRESQLKVDLRCPQNSKERASPSFGLRQPLSLSLSAFCLVMSPSLRHFGNRLTGRSRQDFIGTAIQEWVDNLYTTLSTGQPPRMREAEGSHRSNGSDTDCFLRPCSKSKL